MKHLLSAFFIFFASAFSAFGQSSYVNIYSTISYDSATNQVTAQAYTQPSYVNSSYYKTAVTGSIRNESGTELAFGNTQGQYGQATVNLSATGTGCGWYRMLGGHWQTDYYYVSNYYYNGSYYTGYWDYYNYNYFNYDQGPGGSPYWYLQTYFGPGPAYATYSSTTIFGNTVEWTKGSCSRPTAPITPIKAVGTGQTALVRVVVNDNPGNETITLKMIPSSGTGAAKFTGTGGTDTNTRTITGTTDVEITGVTENSKVRDMMMEASLGTGPYRTVLNRMNFTVVKATLSIKTSGTVSSDNGASSAINSQIGTLNLGGPAVSTGLAAHLMRNKIEIKATVLPSGWDELATLQRVRVEDRDFNDQSLVSRHVNCPDTSDSILTDIDPQSGGSGGKIYDYDGPGAGHRTSEPVGYKRRMRVNFKQWLTVFQNHGTGTADVRLSDDFEWFNRLSVIKDSGGNTVLLSDVSNDNAFGAGTTALTWDLGAGTVPSASPCS